MPAPQQTARKPQRMSSTLPPRQPSPATGPAPITTSDLLVPDVPTGTGSQAHPTSAAAVDGLSSGITSQLKTWPSNTGDIGELQRRLQHMHSRQGKAGLLKVGQHQSQSPVMVNSTRHSGSPHVSGGLSHSANPKGSVSPSPSPRAVSRHPALQGRSPTPGAGAAGQSPHPRASPAAQQAASPSGLPAAFPIAQQSTAPADSPRPSSAARSSPALHGQTITSPAAQHRASPVAEPTGPSQADPPVARTTAPTDSRAPSPLPTPSNSAEQAGVQAQDMPRDASPSIVVTAGSVAVPSNVA